MPPPPSLFAPTTPTYSEDEQEAEEAAEIQHTLLQLTPERLKDLDHVHDPMPSDVGDPRNGGGNSVNNQEGFERPRTPFAFPDIGTSQLIPNERVRRMSEWVAGVSPEDGVPPSERSFIGSQGSAVASLTVTVGDSASAAGIANALELPASPPPAVKTHLDETKSQTSGAGPSMTREERIRQMQQANLL